MAKEHHKFMNCGGGGRVASEASMRRFVCLFFQISTFRAIFLADIENIGGAVAPLPPPTKLSP